LIKKLNIKLTILKTRAHKIAEPKPLMWKPGTVYAVSQSMNPLITRVNKPRVMIFSGRVRMIKMGRITAFTIPKMIEPKTAPIKLSSNPGMR
jgi:hypothetical protein